ncbi:MAG: TIM barrel protein, partial [Thermoplasmata archaeon]|nr:TIM barrel protein [Thermoplasmata archaeon]
MLRFGPGGIPLSCKGRTLKDGVADAHYLGLTAVEFQMVRILNIVEREVRAREVGLLPTEIGGEIIIDVLRKRGDGFVSLGAEEKLRREDMVASLSTMVAKDYRDLEDARILARDLDVQISLHAPYYLDLVTEDQEHLERAYMALQYTGTIAKALGASVVTFHGGVYHVDREDAVGVLIENMRPIIDWYIENKVGAKLGIETSGKQDVFGSLEEVVETARNLKNTIPVLNFPHIHAREGGSLREVDDYVDVFKRTRRTQQNNFYTHFSGVEHDGRGNEKRYTPLKKGDLRFEVFAEFLLDNPYQITIISSSPLLEHDAVYMRVIYERLAAKREAKKIREEKKALEEEAKKMREAGKKEKKDKKAASSDKTGKKGSAQKKTSAKKPGSRGKGSGSSKGGKKGGGK